MTRFIRGLGLAWAILGFALAAPAGAQESLDSGKTGAQMFASDCAICHKSAESLNRSAGGLFGLADFLREHYTASRESASKIAAYLTSLPPPAVKHERVKKRSAKGDKSGDKSKGAEKKTKSDEAKSSKSSKPADAKPSGAKTKSKSEAKPAEAKSNATTPKAGEAKASKESKESKETKPGKGKKSTAKPKAAAATKPNKPAKPD
jgi:hypothetical protein